MKTFYNCRNNLQIEKYTDRECISVVVNNVEMICFGEEGNKSENEKNAEQFIELLQKAWRLNWI